MIPPAELRAIRARCTRTLSGHGPKTGRAWLDAMADADALDLPLDVYSEGPAITRLEQETAALLGKPAALFFAKGIVAQQAALLAYATPARGRTIALHPRSHLAEDESDALDRLARLHPLRVGAPETPFTTNDLAKLHQPLAAVTVELPIRRAGFLANSWAELEAIAAWCRDSNTPFHLDGARIWEIAPYYGKSLAEIAALSDSIYVSFYKGLGGMGGCVLAGPQALIDAAKPWRNRYGGDMPTIFPYVITALQGLQTHLLRMPDYHAHACTLAAALRPLPFARPLADPPHGNSFAIQLDISPEALEQAQANHAAKHGTWLFSRILPTAWPNRCTVEVAVGTATLGWTAEEFTTALTDLLT
jgi:threonine aldolase